MFLRALPVVFAWSGRRPTFFPGIVRITESLSLDAGSKPQRFGHAAVIALLGGAQALILVAGLARWKIIAIVLGPSGVGVAGVIDQAAQIALQLGALNIPTAALRFLAIAEAERGAEGFSWLYRTFLRAVLSSAAIAAGAGIALYVAWPTILGAGMAAYGGAVAFALAAVPLTAATNLVRNVLATLHRHRSAAATLMVSSTVLAVGTYLGLRFGGLTGAYLAAMFVGVATVAALHLLVVPTLRNAPPTGSVSLIALLKANPDIVRFSATLYAVGFSVPLSYGIVRWTVLGTLGLRDAGFLAAAYTVASGLRVVFSQASTQYLIPLTSRSREREASAAEVAKYIRTLILLLLVGVLPLVLFPYELLVALYSRKFAVATDILGVFILADAILALGDAYRVLLLGFNDLAGYFTTTVTRFTVVSLGVWWVVPRFGLRGVALLEVTAAVLVLAQAVGRVRLKHGLRLERRTLAMTAFAIGALAAAAASGRAFPAPVPARMAVKAVVGIALVLGAWRLLPRSERHGAVRLLRRRG